MDIRIKTNKENLVPNKLTQKEVELNIYSKYPEIAGVGLYRGSKEPLEVTYNCGHSDLVQ